MNKELIEKLALVYAAANAEKGCTINEIHALYLAGKQSLDELEQNRLIEQIATGNAL